MKNVWWIKLLRILGIVLMALTAAFTLMGGAGTTCVAVAAEKYDSMAAIVAYKWLYLLFVLVTTAIGVMGVRAVVLLIKGRRNAYRYTMIALISGVVVGVIHMIVSRTLRGSSMPVDAVVYTTILTLIFFLILRIPGIWSRFNVQSDQGGNTMAGGMAAIVMGVLCLTIHIWMGPTHTWHMQNYADVWHPFFQYVGWGLILAGCGVMMHAILRHQKSLRVYSLNFYQRP